MTEHLTDEQIDLLLSGPSRRQSVLEVDDACRLHLEQCGDCRRAVQDEEIVMGRLARLRIERQSAPGPECPPLETWPEIATGIPGPRREFVLRHAAGCDHCGSLLRQAVQDLSDAETPEEAARLNAMENTSDAWQANTAQMLRKAGGVITPGAEKATSAWTWRRVWRWPNFALASALIVAIAAGVFGFMRLSRDPARLVQQAYAERRTIELRFDGAPHVRLDQQRAGENAKLRMYRPALLHAEDVIAQALRKQPNDVRWLQASGRAILLEDDPDTIQQAVEFLERANMLAPEDRSISTDLASAYLLRADLSPVQVDRGHAVDILKQLFDSNRGGEAADWNYGLALEKSLFWSDAVETWTRFLRRYPKSEWVPDAQRHLRDDQELVRNMQKRGAVPLESPGQVAAAYEKHDAGALAAIDARIEEYQEAAIANWLPMLFSGRASDQVSPRDLQSALSGLSLTLLREHGDAWLADMLARRSAPMMRKAVPVLGQGAATVETSDLAAAERAAASSESYFKEAHSPAGVTRARLIAILAAQYEHRDRDCRRLANELGAFPALDRYPWIAIQVHLENSLCSALPDAEAVASANAAAAMAKAHRFPVLSMRCLTTQASLFASLGEANRAWAKASESLDLFWKGAFPPIRGYNALIALDEINRSTEQWHLQADILREAIPIIQDDPRTMMVAVAFAHLGEALFRISDWSGAESAFQRCSQLGSLSAAGREREALHAEAELGLARIELETNHLDDSRERLRRIRPSLMEMADNPLEVEYLLTSGTAYVKSDRLDDAEHEFNAALEIAENSLRAISSGDERWKSARQFTGLYRAVVQSELRRNPGDALRAWESLKGLALQEDAAATPSEPGSDALQAITRIHLVPPGPSVTTLAYLSLPTGFVVWVWDESGIREKSINVDMTALTNLSSRFIAECSDPNSDLALLKRDGASLYSFLIRPIEPWIQNRQRIVLEPDGILKRLPLALLVDSRGNYLGDRAISVSPGFAYLNMGRTWNAISSASSAVIIANPQGQGWTPLPAANDEARTVASSFTHPYLSVGTGTTLASMLPAIARAEVFHFSGHSSANWDGPALVLGNDQSTMASIYSAISGGKTRLVVLSACSTSGGPDTYFDGDNSIIRALLAGHVTNVVASRWNIDSESTALLMKTFYAHLMSDHSVSESLSDAMHVVRNIPGYEHPYYWAAFSVFGRG